MSVGQREDRKEPAFSFGGRYSNDLNGQDLQKSFQDHKDKADRISTALTIKTEDGVRKIYVFGNKVSEKNVGDQPSPNPSPANSGSSNDGPSTSPPQQPSSPNQPAASDSSAGATSPSGQGGSTGSPAGGAGSTQPPPQASSGNNSASGANDAPSSQPQPPQPAITGPQADPTV